MVNADRLKALHVDPVMNRIVIGKQTQRILLLNIYVNVDEVLRLHRSSLESKPNSVSYVVKHLNSLAVYLDFHRSIRAPIPEIPVDKYFIVHAIGTDPHRLCRGNLLVDIDKWQRVQNTTKVYENPIHLQERLILPLGDNTPNSANQVVGVAGQLRK